MVLKRHHKIFIGSFSTLLILLLILNSFFIYFLYLKIQYNNDNLEKEIYDLRMNTNSKINELSTNIIRLQNDLSKTNLQIGTIDEQFKKIKYSSSPDFSEIVKDSVDSVITIRTDISQGTGFLISEDGYIITNDHIIKGAKSAVVLTFDGNSYNVSIVGRSPSLDLCLLKIDGKFKKLKLGNSDEVKLGEKVIAIGNPLGLQFSVSEGVVSGIHRLGPNNLEAYIQTDAALNPGNSGGPLINREGEVIGINNFKSGIGENLGFALESNYIKEFVDKIFIEKNNQTFFNY